MACTDPIYAVYLGTKENGKKSLKILPHRGDLSYVDYCNRYGKDNILMLPCGHCDKCIEKRTRAWAARCVLEASSYDQNCFVTLTYRDSCLPKGGLCKSDIQKFIKRLRKYLNKDIKYFACGEYSPKGRPHYHIIIFNWFPEDARYVASNRGTDAMYDSKVLTNLWKYGLTSVGDLTFKSCAYVARYCQKKLQHGINKDEFSLMSKGIGEDFALKHLEKIYDTDTIYFYFGKNKEVAPSRYFDKLLEKVDPTLLAEVKDKRISNQDLSIASSLMDHSFKYVEELNLYNAEIKRASFKRLVRKGVQ